MAEFLKLKKSDCKNCYKCIRHCPVKSIRFSGNRAYVVYDECILCGQCYVVCPQNAKETVDETEIVDAMLADASAPVIASVAPSFIAYFEGASIGTLTDALKKLGFAGVEETARGATMVKREFEKMLLEKKQDVIITSCCHSVNLLIGKHYPNVMKYLAPVVSPMQAHCQDIKERFPGAHTVFIGPCLSKKDEAYNGTVDAVLTFRELAAMFRNAGIVVENGTDVTPESRARLFPVVGGILKTMDLPDNGYTYLTVDGVENCKAALADIESGDLTHCFIEMSACAGSCTGGPIMEKFRNSPVRHTQAVMNYAGRKDFDVPDYGSAFLHKDRPNIAVEKRTPNEEEIRDILRRTGKNSPADELNCGSCGYDTCREKAIAVWQGKADISMCLPYLMEKAERFSDNILRNTPNGILVVNEDLEVQQLNRAALVMFDLKSASDVLGEQVVRLMDPLPFIEVLDEHKPVRGVRNYYPEYKRYLELTIIHDKTSRVLITILRDVTEEETERVEKEKLGRQTVEIADKVVDKQMRIVQEIASLLGETAAETKIALTKLKESIADEQH